MKKKEKISPTFEKENVRLGKYALAIAKALTQEGFHDEDKEMEAMYNEDAKTGKKLLNVWPLEN